ncbi:uncharacterized protein LOC113469152 [Diaphorina citri]|uniref:Uncharacterized protein LOC113469152 n=1 Tax=Diaphorina citri TaxID=121845 RepID=A0A3Q0J6V2_DIACI|nr:uncharacterized protein LOC113469152 [Diaphorina citri]
MSGLTSNQETVVCGCDGCFYNPIECNLLINAIQLCRNLNLDQSERITLEKALIIEAWNKMQSRKSIDPIDSGLINQSSVADITSSEGLTHHLQGQGADTNSRKLIHHLQGQGPVTERNSRELIHHLQGQGPEAERNLGQGQIDHLQGQGPVMDANSGGLIHHFQGPEADTNSRGFIHHLQGSVPESNSGQGLDHLLPVANFTNLYERNVYRILFQYVLNDIPIGQIIEFL